MLVWLDAHGYVGQIVAYTRLLAKVKDMVGQSRTIPMGQIRELRYASKSDLVPEVKMACREDRLQLGASTEGA
jgi:hypothetical protein